MKTLCLFLLLSLFSPFAFSQEVDLSKVDESNTWLKVGPNIGIPLFTTRNSTSMVLGLDVSMQFLRTKASGIGVKTGYSQYFSKVSNVADFGEIPLAIMYRFYPKSTGYFAGLDVGYSLILNSTATTGGYMMRPQVGYHSDYWNYFLYLNYISYSNTTNDGTITSLGIGITRNIKFGN